MFKADRKEWTIEPQTLELGWYQGESHAGRYRYFAQRGFGGDDMVAGDPALRVLVEDTESGDRRPAFDDRTGV